MSHTAVVRPMCRGMPVAVTEPSRTVRRGFTFNSMPTTALSGPARTAVPNEATVSHRAAVAPPWSSPDGWGLPPTGEGETGHEDVLAGKGRADERPHERGTSGDQARPEQVGPGGPNTPRRPGDR